MLLFQMTDLSNMMSSSSMQNDSIASSIMNKVFSTPLFAPKDKSRRMEQLQRELDEANVALLRLKSRLDHVENVSWYSVF